MATIRPRKRTDGRISYTVQIRLIREGAQVYQENQTFARKQAAQAWVRKREAELDQPGATVLANRVGATVKEMIERYMLEMVEARASDKTKPSSLCRVCPNDKRLGVLKEQTGKAATAPSMPCSMPTMGWSMRRSHFARG